MRRLARNPGLELLFFLQLRGDRLGFTARPELADADAIDGRRAVGRRQHVRRVSLRAQTALGDRLGLAADVERRNLDGEALSGRLGRGLVSVAAAWNRFRRRARETARPWGRLRGFLQPGGRPSRRRRPRAFATPRASRQCSRRFAAFHRTSGAARSPLSQPPSAARFSVLGGA